VARHRPGGGSSHCTAQVHVPSCEVTGVIVRTLGFHAGLLAGSVLLAVLHTFPLVRHLDTHLPGQGLGDNVSFLWNAWWMREALASPYVFFHCPIIEAPVGASLALHTHTALPAFLAASVLAPLPLVRAHNLLLIASLALNGLAAYALAFVVTRARAVSVLAGVLFLIAPTFAGRLMGHYNLLVAWPLVFACAAYVAWWQRPTASTAVGAAVMAALIPYGDYYYAVYFVLFALVYAVLELWHVQVDFHARPPTVISRLVVTLAALAFLAGIVIAALPALRLDLGFRTVRIGSGSNALTAGWALALVAALMRWRPSVTITGRQPFLRSRVRTLIPGLVVVGVLVAPLMGAGWTASTASTAGDYVTQASSLKSSPRGIDVASLVLGPPFAGVAGPAVRAVYRFFDLDVMEACGWLGVVPMALLVFALIRARHVRDVRRWLIVGAVFGVWALGPYLTILDQNSGLLLPQALAQIVPIVDNARIPGRAMAMTHLSLVVLIAAAIASRVGPGRSTWWLCLFGALAVAESAAAPLPLVALGGPGIHAEIAARPEVGTVLTVPFGVRDGFGEMGLLEHDALYGQTIHRRPIAGGFIARLPPRVWSWYQEHEPYRTLLALSKPGTAAAPLPSCEATMAGLRAATVRFVVLYRRDASPALMELVESRLPLVRVADDGWRVLFAVDGARPCAGAD
jgi:hypothetical protein